MGAFDFYVSFHHKKTLFGNIVYTPYVCDQYGECHQTMDIEHIPVEEKEKLADYLKTRGFTVKWSHGKHLRHLRQFRVIIKNKAQEAQFALINVGVIQVTLEKPEKKQIFKI